MSTRERPLPDPAPAPELLADDTVELRLPRVLGPGDEAARPPEARALGLGPAVCRYVAEPPGVA